MEAVFIKLLNMSIAASWLILAVVLLRAILKKAPKNTRRILWALVGIRLVLPFSPESFLSLIPSAETVSPDILYAEAPKIHSGISAFNTYVNPVISESLAPAADASVNPMQVVAYIASAVWIIGMITLILYSVISYVRLRRRVEDAVILRDHFWQSEKVASPFVLGLFRPRIYLPFGMDDESLAYVVAHEQAHINHRDHWIKPIGFLLLTVYWFNPLIWLAYILLCRDIELACDERVVKQMSADDKKAYSKALLTCSIDRRFIAACPLAFGEVGVKERIKNVLNYKKPAFWIVIVALVSCIVIAVCFLTNPKSGEDPAKVVGEYDTSLLGGTFATSGNSAYKIGMNAYGMPVFADMDAAFDAILEDCGEGFAYLSNEFSLPAVTKQNYESYKTYGWQTGVNNEAVRKQCVEISQFFDIYENSFSTDGAVVTASTADGNGTYTAGALLGQNGGLSYLPEDGSYYAQIILSNYSLSVINDEGQTIFENGNSKVSHMTRAALTDKLSKANIFGIDEADVPEYDSLHDMMVYSYYASDDVENDIKCSIYWFNGEPKWFAEGEMLRIYVLEPTTPATAYISRSCLYMNSLSSTFSHGDSGCRYLIGADSFTIMNKQTGDTVAVSSTVSWDWQEISEEEWSALFPLGIGAPDIGSYKNPQVMKFSSRYYLFNMDGEIWFGDFHGDKVGMWSVYSLVPESGADGPNSTILQKALALDDVRELSLKGEALTWQDFDQYQYIETGSGLYIRVYAINQQFSLWIGGGSTSIEPMYIYLKSIENPDDYIDIRAEDIEAFISKHTSGSLDAAISAAILEHNEGAHPDGDFACESHVTLGTLEVERWDEESDAAVQTVEVYMMALYQEYGYAGGGFINTGGSHVPCVLTFDLVDGGAYELTEYWEPRDGSYYAPDIEKRFEQLSPEVVADALDTQKFILAQIQCCYAQAVQHGNVAADYIVKELFESIMSSPAESSNPADYIEAHPIEYRELTYYGDYTLRYSFSEFLKGGQTGLKGQLMRIVMDDLAPESKLRLYAETGQEYFDAWRSEAEKLKTENGLAYIQENNHAMWLLLQMLEA